MIKILFVCHGNICRSPMGQYVLQDMVNKAGLAEQFHLFPNLCIDHRKGPGAVAHDMIAAILGIVVNTVTGCLHLFLR